jgi:hypothetical protein
VDKSVDRLTLPAVLFGVPEGAVKDRRNRDHIKGLQFGPVASGALLSATPGFVRPAGDRPTDCDRHPGVGTSVG